MQKSVPSRSLASFSSCIKVCWSSWLRTSSWWSHLTDLTGLLLFLGEEQEPFLADCEAEVPAVVVELDAAAETFFGCLEDWAAALELDDEQWQVEKPLKKQTEHWMAMAPSDFRSNVADCCKIIVIFYYVGVVEAALCTQLGSVKRGKRRRRRGWERLRLRLVLRGSWSERSSRLSTKYDWVGVGYVSEWAFLKRPRRPSFLEFLAGQEIDGYLHR